MQRFNNISSGHTAVWSVSQTGVCHHQKVLLGRWSSETDHFGVLQHPGIVNQLDLDIVHHIGVFQWSLEIVHHLAGVAYLSHCYKGAGFFHSASQSKEG